MNTQPQAVVDRILGVLGDLVAVPEIFAELAEPTCQQAYAQFGQIAGDAAQVTSASGLVTIADRLHTLLLDNGILEAWLERQSAKPNAPSTVLGPMPPCR